MKLNILSAIAAVGMLATSSSQAALTLTFSDGTTTKSFNDTATPGSVAPATTTVGGWILSGASATFAYGTQSNPQLYYNGQFLVGGGNTTTLTVTLMESGLTAIPSSDGTIFMALASQQNNAGSKINVGQIAEIDGTPVGSANSLTYLSGGGYPHTASSTINTSVTENLDSTYDLTEVLTITGTGGAALSLSGLDLVPAPEPSTCCILVSALLFLPLVAKLRRRSQAV
jgi:hypothetical protein